MKIQTWRVYEAAGGKGFRVLVDRLWPRGLRKEDIRLDLWLKEIAPSDGLRKWFGHESVKWEEFKKRYFKELAGKEELIDWLITLAGDKTVVLLYGAKDKEHNQAVALKEYLEKLLVKA